MSGELNEVEKIERQINILQAIRGNVTHDSLYRLFDKLIADLEQARQRRIQPKFVLPEIRHIQFTGIEYGA